MITIKELTAKYEDFQKRYEELLEKYGDSIDVNDLKNSYHTLKETLLHQVTTYISYNDAGEVKKIHEDAISINGRSYKGPRRNPVILIHGFFGSQLTDTETGVNLWGDFDIRESFRVSSEKMRKIAHPMELRKPLDSLNDSIKPSKLLEELNIHFMRIPLKFPAYKDMIDILIKSGFSIDDDDLFLFAYDWRKDLSTSAKHLASFIADKKKALAGKYSKQYGVKSDDIKFDIIAHSMGGLVTRYFLRYGNKTLPDDGSVPSPTWEGAKDIQRAVIVGTPNAGYLDTFLEMVKGSPLQPYPTTVLGTLPSYYQMLPSPLTESIIDRKLKSPLNIFDASVWEKMSWGIAEKRNETILEYLLPDIESSKKRRQTAMEHLEKCLKRALQFGNAMSLPVKPPEGLDIHLICGNGIKTTRRATVTEKGRVDVTEHASGDGKVLTSSALWDYRSLKPDEYLFASPIVWKNIILLRAAHMGITKAAAFEDNIRFLLTT